MLPEKAQQCVGPWVVQFGPGDFTAMDHKFDILDYVITYHSILYNIVD